MGWVLQSFRRYSRTGRAVSMQEMTAQLSAGEKVPHRSHISRWESGSIKPSWTAVLRYERILSLPARQLVAAIDATARAARPQTATPWLTRPAPDAENMRRTVALLDRLDCEEPLNGTDWDHLSSTLVMTPTVLLSTRTWRTMIRRGVDELAVSLGLAYAQRFEAMARLAANPTSAGAVVDVVREVVDEPGYPVFSEAISLLRFSRAPAATGLLLRLIERPANPLVLRAALVTYTAQRGGGPTRELPSGQAAQLAVQALRGPYATYRVRHAAADLLHALPEPHSRRLLAALGGKGIDPAALSVLQYGTALDVQRRRALTELVYTSLESRLGRSDLDEDPELRRRVVIALEHANDEIRGQTLLVFMLSPLAPALAGGLSGALRQAIAERDMTMAQEALRPLTYLSSRAQLDELTRLVVEPLDVPGGREVAGEAAWVLGNIVEPSGSPADQRDHQLAAALTTGLGQPYRGSLPHALIYALAMRHRTDLLAGLSATAEDPALNQSLQWWLAHPLAAEAVRDDCDGRLAAEPPAS